MINLELFSCAGGMAEGFRRAGVTFDIAVDFATDHCDSYQANHGHRPVCMDIRDLLRMVEIGWRVELDLLVADPPCTPWSRAGKRQGTSDDRDMLEDTCRLIALLRPRRYLIGNVPGLDDNKNLPIVQRVIGGLGAYGYCTADFVRLDAADYGVPQHRIRPFWFGHLAGPCIRWPVPTHGDPASASVHSPLLEGLRPWVTCEDALGHLDEEQLGRPVRMRRPPIGEEGRAPSRHVAPVHTSESHRPARSITTQCRAPGHATTIVFNQKHPPAVMDRPAPTLGAKPRGQSEVLVTDRKKRPPSTQGPQRERVHRVDAPSPCVLTDTDRATSSSIKLEWPWPRPATTVTGRPGLAPPGHHDENFAIMSLPDAIVLSEHAAKLLQGFPEGWTIAGRTKKARWSQIGQAMPPGLAHAVAMSVVAQNKDPDERS